MLSVNGAQLKTCLVGVPCSQVQFPSPIEYGNIIFKYIHTVVGHIHVLLEPYITGLPHKCRSSPVNAPSAGIDDLFAAFVS